MGSIIGGAGYGGSVWNNPAYQKKTAGASGTSGTNGTSGADDVSGTSGTSGAGDVSGTSGASGLPMTEMCGLPSLSGPYAENRNDAFEQLADALWGAEDGTTSSVVVWNNDEAIVYTGTRTTIKGDGGWSSPGVELSGEIIGGNSGSLGTWHPLALKYWERL